MRHSMDFDDSCYFTNRIDDCVHDYVQDLFIKDELTDVVGKEEEQPPREITQEEERQEVQNKPSSGKKWRKQIDTKKKEKRSSSPTTSTIFTRPLDFSGKELVSFLSMHAIGHYSSTAEGERLHLFEPL